MEARENLKTRWRRQDLHTRSQTAAESSSFSMDQLTKLMKRDQLNRRLDLIRQQLLQTSTIDGAPAMKIVSEDNTVYTLKRNQYARDNHCSSKRSVACVSVFVFVLFPFLCFFPPSLSPPPHPIKYSKNALNHP